MSTISASWSTVRPYHANPLPMTRNPGAVELVREAATLVMLLAIGMVAGRTRTSRLGYAALRSVCGISATTCFSD